MRGYIIPAGNGKSIIIHKESPTKWRIRPSGFHSSFFFEQHKLLRDARKAAEAIARDKRGWDAVLELFPKKDAP